MVLSIGFLVLIVLVSGGIAVLADWLGRKVGKKKLTIKTRWFRLRPKATAQLSTFLSGVLISFFTMLIVSLAIRSVGQWIQEGPKALELLEKQRAESRNLATRNEGLRSEIEDRSGQLKELQAKDEELKSEVATLKGETGDLQLKLAKYQNNLAKARDQYTRIQRAYSKARDRLAKLQPQLDKAKEALRLASQNVHRTQTELRTARTSLNATRGDLQLAESNFTEAVKQKNEATTQVLALTNQQSQLEADVRQLGEQRDQAQKDLDGVLQTLAATQDNLLKLQVEAAQMDVRLRDSYQAIRDSMNAVDSSRKRPLMFSLGEEITRQTVSANATLEEAHQAIRQLIRSAEVAALQKGAKAKGPYPAAGIFDRTDMETKRHWTPEELESQLAEAIANKGEEQLLIAMPTLNAFQGEPVSLEIAVAENPIVYKASAVVAESQIDGRKDNTVILNQITDFVSNKVKEKARLDRMVAKRGGDGEFGSIAMSDLYALVDRVRAMGRTVRLQAVAETDTRAGDPLKLDFRLK